MNGPVAQNEICYIFLGETKLMAEVIKVNGKNASIQVYESTRGVKEGCKVEFEGHMLEVILGPGLLSSNYDGLQNNLATMEGVFLKRGEYTSPIDMDKEWEFTPMAKEGDVVVAADWLGEVKEGWLPHKIMVPFSFNGSYKVKSVAKAGNYKVTDTVAVLTDANGQEHNVTMIQKWPVKVAIGGYKEKPRPYRIMETGVRIIDTLNPIAEGGTGFIPGPFGCGKTVLQHAIAKQGDADVIVMAACGERANEVVEIFTEFPELIDPRTGRSLMERTILIANTSNMPVAAREVSLYSGITLAEYYRDMGMAVAIMADSTSRWAEALRELSGRMEEMPAEEGFPAYLPTRLAEFYERAGRITSLCNKEGSVSVIGAVSPPGGDFSEPVTQHTKRFIRCFWALDRELANARHYPAISWIDSYSEYAEEVKDWWEKTNPQWAEVRYRALELLKKEQKLEQIVRLIGADALPDSERIVLVVAEMMKNGFLQQNAFDDIDAYCGVEKQIKILVLIMKYYNRALAVVKAGAPLPKVVALSSREKIIRIKSLVKNDDMKSINEIENLLDSEFTELERIYQVSEAAV